MKGAFGLVALLIAAFIVVYLWSQNASEVAKAKKNVEPQLQQWTGRSASGKAAHLTATYEAVYKGGSTKYLLVKTVEPGGLMDTHFGLRPGDQIKTIGQLDVTDAGEEMLTSAYQSGWPLRVIRDNEEISLPQK